MSPEKKKDLTETAVGRLVDAKIGELKALQEKRDAEQDAKLARPSRAAKAITTTLDVTEKYPVASWVIGIAFVAASLMYLDGPKLYIGSGIGVCFVPGLARKVIGLAAGLKKAKGDA